MTFIADSQKIAFFDHFLAVFDYFSGVFQADFFREYRSDDEEPEFSMLDRSFSFLGAGKSNFS